MSNVSISLYDDVKLKTTENPWKPARLQNDVGKSEEEKGTERLLKEVRGILNKFTPQNFDYLLKKFQQLPINSEHRLNSVINLIFDQVVNEPNYSKAYANMCKLCSRLEVTKIENDVEQRVNFRKFLITRCQQEFEKNVLFELDTAKWLEEIKNCTDPEQKKELQLSYEEKEMQIVMKAVGNVRFIGELFKLEMLTSAIMNRCIEHLLSNPNEMNLQCFCKLLTTIGKEFEFGKLQSLNPYFERIYELSQKREGSKISSRVRFMLQDVIELRQNNWVPRREDNNPIELINKEAERKAIYKTRALQQQPLRMNRQNNCQDNRKRDNRAGNNLSENGWVSVPRYRHSKFNIACEASKMANIVKNELDLNSVSLGGRHRFIFQNAPWSKTKNMENKTGQSTFTSTNCYSVSRDEKKPASQPNINEDGWLSVLTTTRYHRSKFNPATEVSKMDDMVKGRGSQQGIKSKGDPKMSHLSISLHDKLKSTKNTWKPGGIESDHGKSEEEKETEWLLKEVRSVLNKLTPQKFDTLMMKFQQLPINSEHRLNSVVDLIFLKAVNEPNFSKAYANMCKLCSRLEVIKIENDVEQRVTFHKLLITRCQQEFEKNKWLEGKKNYTDPEQKKELQLSYEDKERQQMKLFGNIWFIGELFKLEMLTSADMYRCIEHLLSNPDEQKLECLCKLLMTFGKELEIRHQIQKQSMSLNPYFQRIYELSQKREGSKISSKVRFMLQDVIELRQNNWVSRREDNDLGLP